MKKYNLIILPGWGGSQETWQDFLDYFRKEKSKKINSIEVLNLPCFGDEPCPDDVWGVEDYVEFAKQKIEEKKVDNLVILGHSFGGAVATKFVYNYPKKAEKLILTAPAILRPEKTTKRLFFGAIAKMGKVLFKFPYLEKFDLFAKKLLYRITGSQDYLKTSGIKRDIFKKIIRQDQRDLLSQIDIKTLLLWGKKDKLLPVENTKIISNKLKNCKLKIIDNGTHGLHKSSKKDLKEEVNTFLN